MKIDRAKQHRAEIGGLRSEDRRPRTEEEPENTIGERRAKAAMNCTSRWNFGRTSIVSPKKLNKAREAAESQKLAEIPNAKEAKTKAARNRYGFSRRAADG